MGNFVTLTTNDHGKRDKTRRTSLIIFGTGGAKKSCDQRWSCWTTQSPAPRPFALIVIQTMPPPSRRRSVARPSPCRLGALANRTIRGVSGDRPPPSSNPSSGSSWRTIQPSSCRPSGCGRRSPPGHIVPSFPTSQSAAASQRAQAGIIGEFPGMGWSKARDSILGQVHTRNRIDPA